jgi:predicted HicB family RNase H-like nuclease
MTESKKMTIYIDPQIHTDVKVFAAKKGKSISEVSETALKEYLERNDEK